MIIHPFDYEDARWKMLSDERKAKDNYTCQNCGSKFSLQAHHLEYKGARIWDTPIELLITFCEECHQRTHDKVWHSEMVKKIVQSLYEDLCNTLGHRVRKGYREESFTVSNHRLNHEIFFGFVRDKMLVYHKTLSAKIHCTLEQAQKLVNFETLRFIDENLNDFWRLNENYHSSETPFTSGFNKVKIEALCRWHVIANEQKEPSPAEISQMNDAVVRLISVIEES